MLLKTLDIPAEQEAAAEMDFPEMAEWFRPYYAAALRSGITGGISAESSAESGQSIPAEEASVLLSGALRVAVSGDCDLNVPVWFPSELSSGSNSEVPAAAQSVLTREQAANALCELHRLVQENAGMSPLLRGSEK